MKVREQDPLMSMIDYIREAMILAHARYVSVTWEDADGESFSLSLSHLGPLEDEGDDEDVRTFDEVER